MHAHIDCRCNVRTGSPIWAVTSIACTLMVMIYALGNISGANFNLAVSAFLAIAGKENMQIWASTWLVKLSEVCLQFWKHLDHTEQEQVWCDDLGEGP